jgi:hypothetical protein
VRENVARQTFGGQQVNEFTVFVELGIAFVEHFYSFPA